MLLIYTKFLVPKGFRGLTIYPFVFLNKESDRTNLVFINHEKIHLRQQVEMLLIPFFIWYAIEFGIRLLHYKNRSEAYLNISFEREAYANESDLRYLKNRKHFAFLKYRTLSEEKR
jgi:hypothetical protein